MRLHASRQLAVVTAGAATWQIANKEPTDMLHIQDQALIHVFVTAHAMRGV